MYKLNCNKLAYHNQEKMKIIVVKKNLNYLSCKQYHLDINTESSVKDKPAIINSYLIVHAYYLLKQSLEVTEKHVSERFHSGNLLVFQTRW